MKDIGIAEKNEYVSKEKGKKIRGLPLIQDVSSWKPTWGKKIAIKIVCGAVYKLSK